MKKSLIVGALALSVFPFFATPEASASSMNNTASKVNSVFQKASTCDVLYCDSKSGNGRVYFDFRYYGSEDNQLRINIQNSGSKPFTYRIENPDGSLIASGITVKAGSSETPTFTTKSYGLYQIRLDNSDGSRISASVRVRAL